MSERSALDLAAGKLRGVFVAVQAELLQDMPRLMGVVTGTEPCLDVGERCFVAGKIRLLRQVTDRRAGLDETHPAVRLDQASHDLEQRRFPRPIAPDQANAFAL